MSGLDELLEQEPTVRGLFEECDKWGAAKIQMVFSDGDDVPIAAVIAVRGAPETAEIIDAVEAVQQRWDDESE